MQTAHTPQPPPLPAGLHVFERGWLSANSVLCLGPEGSAVVDSGYCSHAVLTLAWLEQALAGQPLQRLLNTHLHSDHCGGNAALQQRYPGLRTAIPPGQADAVQDWDEARLSFRPTGQTCPRFSANERLWPGSSVTLAQLTWQVLAAPGHDPHAVLLFEPEHGLLISGDALWDNGFGVVFPEIEGLSAFDAVADTLDLIATLPVQVVIPGHGPVFGGSTQRVQEALARARSRLMQFRTNPQQHTVYAAKVLLKFKLMELQRLPLADFMAWACHTPYLLALHQAAAPHTPLSDWVLDLLQAMSRSASLRLENDWVANG